MTDTVSPPVIDPSELRIVAGQPTTTSMQVAEHFGKLHKDVLKRINNLDCSEEFRQRNFAPTIQKVPGPNGALRSEPSFRMTRDGFTFLCMGFTGKEAAKWKEAYINAFNQLEEQLHKQQAVSEPRSARVLVAFGANGEVQSKPVAKDACIIRPQDLADWLADPHHGPALVLLPGIIEACAKRLNASFCLPHLKDRRS